MTVGTSVRIQTGWSQFDGREGVIVDLHPVAAAWALVMLDGETMPLRFDIASLIAL